MEAIEAVVITSAIAIATPFLVGFWVRMGQTIFSTRAQERANETKDDQ